MKKETCYVYKYRFAFGYSASVSMPAGAKILSIQFQNGVPCIWAMVNPENPFEYREFEIYGTGHTITDPESLVHISTLQQDAFVWHLFERRRPAAGAEQMSYATEQSIVEALAELADLVDAHREGEYKIDSFTTQPARIAIARAADQTRGKTE